MVFKLNEIRELIKLLDETSIVELQVESDGTKLAIRKTQAVAGQPPVAPAALVSPAPLQQPPLPAPALVPEQTAEDNKTAVPAPAPRVSMEDANVHKITSPMVGTFYAAPSPDAPPYVQVGSKVTEKSVVCIVEAMKLMNEIEADVRGEIVDILVENGQLVEYGQPMFLVRVE